MKKMTHEQIRAMWFDFFKSKEHHIEESASLIPVGDDSLLWINAGVTPLKKYFDGSVVPDNKRIVNIQKCIRTNDIENVGVTKRHQTFFEMMGNFSIGDYFKEEAIEFAFELLTSKKWFGIPLDKLYMTVYTHDLDAYNKWLSLGVKEDHLIKLDENFWEIGEGPCGPDSEIFFDRGEKYDPDGKALEHFKKDEEQERYVEIWNNVFSQYNAKPSVPREKYKELPHKNIDTGAGLERWCTVFQGVDSNFDTDLFTPIIRKIEEMSGVIYGGEMSFKVIADHIRAITFALSDGAIFENTGRGYVLRRLLRRSVRFGKKLGFEEPFLYQLVDQVVDTMKGAYPYLKDTMGRVKALVLEEETLFHGTLAAGEKRLALLMKESLDKTIRGKDAFILYDTYGFPFELTEEYLEEKGYHVSREEFDQYMEEQKALAKKSHKGASAMTSQKEVLLNFKKDSAFLYDTYELKSSVIGLIDNDSSVKELTREGYVILKKTCFYALSGGQVSDTGMMVGKHFKARVLSVFKGPNGQHVHHVQLLEGKMKMKDDCDLILDVERRKMIEHHHSSVHILQYVLREVLSHDVHQAGSYVDDTRLRFDFTYSGKIQEEDLLLIEERVNEIIGSSLTTIIEEMPLAKAKEMGAMALFSEKYKDTVRVVRIGESLELCGGTHVHNTRDISRFAILSCESKGSNVYRIEASTGTAIESCLFEAIKPYNDEMVRLLTKAKTIVEKAKKENISLTFDAMIDHEKPTSYRDIIRNRNELSYMQMEVKDLEKHYLEEKEKIALSQLDVYLSQVEEVKGIQVLLAKVQDLEIPVLKQMMDALLNQMKGPGFILFALLQSDGQVTFLARSNSLDAGLVVKEVSLRSLGKGGGSKTFAQGGGKTVEQLDDIFYDIKRDLYLS